MNNNIPLINRARFFYVYDEQGTRYLDFSLGGGSTALGHRHLQLNKTIKNSINRGLLGSMYSRHHIRVNTKLNKYYKNGTLVAVLSIPGNNTLNSHAFFTHLSITQIEDLSIICTKEETTQNTISTHTFDAILYRPFSQIDMNIVETINTRYMCILLPIEWSNGIVAVYAHNAPSYTNESPLYIEPPTYILSGIHYIVSKYANVDAKRPHIEIAKNRKDIYVLDTYSNDEIQKRYSYTHLPLPSSWKRQGIYIILPEYSTTQYQEIWNKFLTKGFYLPVLQNTSPRVLTIPQYITAFELSQWKCVINQL